MEIMSLPDIKKQLSDLLTPSRFAHCLRVSQTAMSLAPSLGLDPDKAYLAGLIHDCAKQLTPQTAAQKGIYLPSSSALDYASYPSVWHALVAPYVCEQLFGIEDEEVLSAVKWHTTGFDTMSGLDELIYVADFIEPGREDEDKEWIADYFMQNSAMGVYALSAKVVSNLVKKGVKVHPYSLVCYRSYEAWVPAKCVEDVHQRYGMV